MRHLVLAALPLLLAACGDDGSSPAAGTTTSTTGGSTTGGGGTGGEAPATCSEGLGAGNHDLTIAHGGVDRSVRLHVPTSYDPQSPPPLVLNFHGYTSDPGEQALFSAYDPKSNEAGFIVAYPKGDDESWNGGICCGKAAADDRDDVGFVRAVVAEIAASVCIDEKRVYSTGMSNGGYLSHRLGCEAADLFAAIAPVAGVLGIPEADCKPTRPMPIIHFYGTADTLVPYDGGGLLGSPSAADTNAGWLARNGCTGMPVVSYEMGTARCETHDQCEGGAQVTFCTIEGMGHCWPGQPVCPFGESTTDISANDEMWSFFEGFSLP